MPNSGPAVLGWPFTRVDDLQKIHAFLLLLWLFLYACIFKILVSFQFPLMPFNRICFWSVQNIRHLFFATPPPPLITGTRPTHLFVSDFSDEEWWLWLCLIMIYLLCPLEYNLYLVTHLFWINRLRIAEPVTRGEVRWRQLSLSGNAQARFLIYRPFFNATSFILSLYNLPI